MEQLVVVLNVEDAKAIRATFEKSLRQTNRMRTMKGLEPFDTDVFGVGDEMTSENPEVVKLWNNFKL